MPRRTSAATLPESPEHQVGTDSQLAELDEHGLERLPDFGDSASTVAPNGTNGHVPEGVRPSERCPAIAPAGPLIGSRCTLREEHDAWHSWDLNRTAPEAAEAAQPTLPGTPEPEVNDYTVPTEASFGKKNLMPAPGLKAIGERLIADDDSLEHLLDVEIRYAWRRRGGTQGGTPRFARIKRPSVWEDYFTGGRVVFLLDVSADHVREHRFTDQQIEAAIHEQLCKTDVDPDDHDAYRIIGPDFSGSIRTLDRYGAWRPDLREMRAHVAKLPLEEAIEAAADSDQDEQDDGDDA